MTAPRRKVEETMARVMRSRIKALFDSADVELTAGAIGYALGLAPSAVLNTLVSMRNDGEMKSRDPKPGRRHSVLMWSAVLSRVMPRQAFPFRPYVPPKRAGVIPVRSGGGIAPSVCDAPYLGLGHWTRNEYSPTEAFS